MTVTSLTIAVLGAGRMGLPISAALVRAGHEVGVHDVRPSAADGVRAQGARWCATAVDAIEPADVVLTVLPGSPELRDRVLGPSDFFDRFRTNAVWIDCTSAAPDLVPELDAAAAAHGVAWLDAPLGGGRDAARAAALTLYIGGDAEVVARTRPVLGAIASTVHHLGGHGAGYLGKLLVNLLWFDQAVAVGEALALAARAGLDLGVFADVLPHSPAASDFVRDYLPRALEGDVVPAFGLDRIVEELDSLVRLATRLDAPFSLGSAATEVHRAALGHYGPRAGELLAIAYLAEQAGIRLTR